MITMSRLGRDGQLGNQLFQYAMLRAVAEKRGFELRIPKHYTGEKSKNMVELEPFSIRAPELRKIDDSSINFPHHFDDKLFRYNAAVFEQPDGTDYRGWYQSEKYFAAIEMQIRKEFLFRTDVLESAIQLLNWQPEDGLVVSLHVRRGDYLQHQDKFRQLPFDYYRQALELMSPESRLVVFSDDCDWCEREFVTLLKNRWVGKRIDVLRGRSHWEDLAAMSLCNHHILAASSFSWWGAWLNPSPGKKVIAPSPWFGPAMGFDERDIVPARWTKIEC